MRFSLLLAGVCLTGCFAQQPVISDIQHDVVKIQIDPNILMKQPTRAEVLAEAKRACGIYNRIPSQVLSQRRFSVGPYEARIEYLIACSPGATPTTPQTRGFSEEDLFSDLEP